MTSPHELLQHAANLVGKIGLELARLMDAGDCWAQLAALLALQPRSLCEIDFGAGGMFVVDGQLIRPSRSL
jgi:hypothetical protein